jgi:nucleoside-diphosphate-sugar epimerase
VEYTETTNLLAPRLLLDVALAHGARTVVFASSLHVYGEVQPALAEEVDLYGTFGDLSHLSKVYVEKLCEMYSRLHGLNCASVRLGLTYGAGPVMKTDYRFLTAPNKFCLQAVRGEPLIVAESGLRPLGLVHLAEAAEALALAGRVTTGYRRFNAATQVASIAGVASLARHVAARHGLDIEVRLPAGAGDVEARGEARQAVPSALRPHGFGSRITLEQGLEETLAHFLRGEPTRGRRCE